MRSWAQQPGGRSRPLPVSTRPLWLHHYLVWQLGALVWNQMAWVCILELLLTGCLPLSKTRNLSVPQLFICKEGSSNSTYLVPGSCCHVRNHPDTGAAAITSV